MTPDELKRQVAAFWNREACGTGVAGAAKYSREYFDQVEAHRYQVEPEIFAFAQFTRYRDQKVLEVGIGAATDFLQWVRSGAKAYGVDLTEQAVEHAKRRLEVYGLQAEEIRVADAENLPYPDEFFDLVYSWGVIHHTPDTFKAFREIVRCTKVGGAIKVMIYNRHSLLALYEYVIFGLARLRPFRPISDILFHHHESPGTKAFTRAEIARFLATCPVNVRRIEAKATAYDLLWYKSLPWRAVAYALAAGLGFHRCGWYMTIEAVKTGPPAAAVSGL